MLIEVYKETGGLPTNLNDLYRDYLRFTYNRYTAERAIRKDGDPNTQLLRLKLPELERRLKRLAFLMIARGKGTAAAYDWARQQVGRTALRDGLNLGVLLREGANIRFYHQSLHGYFAIEPLSRALSVRGFARLTQNPGALVRQIGDLGEAGAPAVEPLIAALHDPDAFERWRAANVLGNIGEPAVEPLIAALRDPDANVRGRAANALEGIGDARAVEPLIAALRDPDKDVRGRAANALAQIGDAHAVEPLIVALADPDANVRFSAADVLEKLRDPRAVEPLKKLLSDTSRVDSRYDKRVCDYAAEALERIGTSKALAAVEEWRREQKNG